MWPWVAATLFLSMLWSWPSFCIDRTGLTTEMTFRIQRTTEAESVILTLTGRIEVEDIAELQRAIHREKYEDRIALDLKDLTLINRDAVKFLAHCETNNITLINCPAYIRQWIGHRAETT